MVGERRYVQTSRTLSRNLFHLTQHPLFAHFHIAPCSFRDRLDPAMATATTTVIEHAVEPSIPSKSKEPATTVNIKQAIPRPTSRQQSLEFVQILILVAVRISLQVLLGLTHGQVSSIMDLR